MKYPNDETNRTEDGRAVVAYILAEFDQSHYIFNFVFEEDAVDFASNNVAFERSVIQTLTIMRDQFEAHVALHRMGGKYHA